MISQILVAVDGSDHATRALELAAELAERFGASLTVLHVMTETGSSAVPEEFSEFERLEHIRVTEYDLYKSAASAIVKAAADRVATAGHPRPTIRIAEGHSAEEIIDVAEDIDADMIVMGRRGLGGVRTLLLGSTSHKVSHTAPCTVVTVK
jgi:nucleotide-binding universal stress UspA family protein